MNILMRESGSLVPDYDDQAFDQPRNTWDAGCMVLHSCSTVSPAAYLGTVPQAAGKAQIEGEGRPCHWTAPRPAKRNGQPPRGSNACFGCQVAADNQREGGGPRTLSVPQERPQASRLVPRSETVDTLCLVGIGIGHKKSHQTPVESGTDDIESLDLAATSGNYW